MTNKQVLVLVLFVTLSGSTAFACSCVEYLVEPGEALQKSALVFSGQVVDVRSIELPKITFIKGVTGEFVPAQHMERRGIYTFRVIQSWKGEAAKEYTIIAGAPPEKPLPLGMILADCDAHFAKGGEYVVFTTDGYPEANPCAPTGVLRADVVRDMNRLRSKARSTAPPN